MPINWMALERNIEQYMQRGSGDKTRNPVTVANTIEKFYISEVVSGGREQYGNPVMYLPSGIFAAILAVQFKACLGVEPPSINLQQMTNDKVSKIESKLPKPPPVPGVETPTGIDTIIKKSATPKLPSTSFTLPTPPIPGLAPKKLTVRIPQIPSAQESNNDVRKRLGLPELPAKPSTPAFDKDGLEKMSLASVKSKMPEIPNPARTNAKVANVISSVYEREKSQQVKMKLLMPDAPIKPPKMSEFKVEVPSLPIDTNILKLNAIGINGVLLTWLSARMGIFVPPPGFAAVTLNMIISPGTIMPMKTALGGSKFASEIVNALKRHAKTITGMVIGVTPTGSPMTVPWVGIS